MVAHSTILWPYDWPLDWPFWSDFFTEVGIFMKIRTQTSQEKKNSNISTHQLTMSQAAGKKNYWIQGLGAPYRCINPGKPWILKLRLHLASVHGIKTFLRLLERTLVRPHGRAHTVPPCHELGEPPLLCTSLGYTIGHSSRHAAFEWKKTASKRQLWRPLQVPITTKMFSWIYLKAISISSN